ncbi:hypothetical protein [Nonomuraea sp. NPDC049141]
MVITISNVVSVVNVRADTDKAATGCAVPVAYGAEVGKPTP